MTDAEFIPPTTRERITLTLPLPPNLANPGAQLSHWKGRHWGKARWMDEAGAMIGLAFPHVCFTHTRVQCHFYVWNLLDWDNLAARQKWVLDFLRKPVVTIQGQRMTFGGWIANDDPEHLDLAQPLQQVDRKNMRVVVTIEVLDPRTA